MINDLLRKLENEPHKVSFDEVIAVIDTYFEFTPTRFENGELVNEAGQNNGSCKIFAFGRLNRLSEAQTLACFGDYYRVDVLQHPAKDDHQNIRNFMKNGWQGIRFDADALTVKS